MDRVRRDLYFRIVLKLMLRPPHPRVLLNLIKYRWAIFRKKTTLDHYPMSVVFYANKLCNFKCSFCYNTDVLNKPDSPHYTLNMEEFERIMNTPYGKNSIRIAFLGGEPFLNPHIIDIFNSPLLRGKISNVVSNASKLKGDLLEKLVASNIDVIGLSLYDNNVADVMHVVQRLNQSNKSYWVQTVADATNLEDLTRKVELCAANDCRNLILSNYNPYFDGKEESMLSSLNENYKKTEALLKLKYADKMNIQWINPVNKKLKKSCKLPFGYIHIDNQGDIAPCCYRYPKGEIYGNIFKDSHWNSLANIQLRENLLNDLVEPIGECKNCENLGRDLYGI